MAERTGSPLGTSQAFYRRTWSRRAVASGVSTPNQEDRVEDRSGIRSQLVEESCGELHGNRSAYGESLGSVRAVMKARAGRGDAKSAQAVVERACTGE